MTQYLLNVIEPAHEPGDVPTGVELERIITNVGALNRDMKAAGVWVFGSSLAHPSASTVVRVQDGDVLLTDGPFAEGKEHVGGFTVIEVGDLDAALDWAGRTAAAIGLPIEVRPFEGVH
jgi:hypothetical protein